MVESKNPDNNKYEEPEGIEKGDKSLFKNSSDSEKKLKIFQKRVTFDKVRYWWHGRVQDHQYRIHFSWPITPRIKNTLAYFGSKLLKD